MSVLTILALFGCVTNLNTKISKIEKTEILNNQQQTTTEQNISIEKNAKKRIGVLLPLTGQKSQIGKSILNSVKLAFYNRDNDDLTIFLRDTQGNPEETKKVITSDGWFKTGDIGVMNNEGYTKIVDRKKDMIIISGFNVYPNEIEEVSMMHDNIFEAGCIGIRDQEGNENIKLFISLVPGENLSSEEVIEHCKKYLTGYKIPEIIEFIDEIPKSNVGKILRRELKER